MKKFLFLAAFMFAYASIYSQSTTALKVNESPEFKDEVKSGGALAIYTSNDGLTGIIRSGKRDFLIDVFDNNLKRVFSKVVESSKKEVFKGYVNHEDEIKFFTVLSPKRKERIVYCHTFNVREKTYNKKELFKTTVEKSGLFSGGNKRQTSVAISPNGQYIAMATDRIKKNLNSYLIQVFNAETLDLVFKKAYQEHKEKYFQPNDLTVDNEGNAYALGKLYKEGKSQRKNGEANYDFILYKVFKEDVSKLSIGLDEEHIASLVINNNGENMQLLGFYSEKKAGRIKGGCNFIIDQANLTVKSKKINKLPEDVFNDLYGYRKAKKKKKKELKSFYVDYVVEDSNGNTFLLAEEFYVTQVYVSTGNGAGYWQTVLHYDDILILKFNTSGEIDWGRSIFKRSTTPSYNVFLKDEKLHVILNSGKNLTEKKDGRTKVSKGWFESSALYDFVYSNNGDVSYDKIQDNKGKTFYLPYFGTYENDRFIMMSSGRKKRQFMSLE